MSTKLSTSEIAGISIVGIFALVVGGLGLYNYKHAKDPTNYTDEDNGGIFVRNNSIGSSTGTGLSRRKKSHSKSKKLRRKK
jgi:hypothetical protein